MPPASKRARGGAPAPAPAASSASTSAPTSSASTSAPTSSAAKGRRAGKAAETAPQQQQQTVAAFVDEVATQPAQFLLARQADDGDAAAALVRAWAARFLQITKELFDRGNAPIAAPMPRLGALLADAARSVRLRGRTGVREGSGATVPSHRAQTVLPELFVSGFDAEQVWAQLQLRHSALLKDLRRALAGITVPAPVRTPPHACSRRGSKKVAR